MAWPPKMTGPELKALGAAIFGFGTGLYWFFKGFKVFREYRVIKDTPEIPIRSISMGLVHVHGKAGGEETVTSPISDTPCLYYQIVVEKWITGARGGGSWTDYRTDSKGVRFNLEDTSGKTAVDLQGAEVKLVPTSVTETQRTQAPPVGLCGEGLDPRLSLAMYEVSDNHLNAYADRLGAHGHSLAGTIKGLAIQGDPGYGAAFNARAGLPRAYRFTEYCIRAGESYDITGTCVENPDAKDVHDRNLIVKGESEPTFLITSKSQTGIESALRRGAMARVFGGAAAAIFCLAFIFVKLGWI